MIGLRRALVTLAVLGAALIAVAIVLVLNSDHVEDRAVTATLSSLMAATWIGTGLFAWWRRPENRIGPLMAATGFSTFFGALATSNDPTVFAVGAAFGSLFLAIAIHMLLAFPTGRLRSRGEGALAAVGYAVAGPAQLVWILFEEDLDLGPGHPPNGLLIADVPAVANVVDVGSSVVGIALMAIAVTLLVRRWRAAGPRERPALTPMLGLGAATIVALGAMLALEGLATDTPEDVAAHVATFGYAALPFAFLLGLVRSRAWRTGAIAQLVGALGRRDLLEGVRRAVGDPALELAYWLPDRERYVGAGGGDVALPPAGDPARASTEVVHDGRRVGALVHDRALCDEPELLDAVAGAAALAMANEQLDAELRARVEELRRSRQRLVEAGMAERRRLERDLHDGAQQRLVSLSLQLGLIAQQLDRGNSPRELVEGAREEARAALEDLRELARGIHPAVLTDRGLGPALEALAERAPVPVEVAAVPDERLPGAVEAAAYFVVAESLTNVAKYARATHASVRVGARDGFALVEVRDDGVGGADPAAGSGLRGLADRLAALDGRLEVESEPGRGTVVRARVPCA